MPGTHISLRVPDEEAAVLSARGQQLVGLRPAHRPKVPVLAGEVRSLAGRVGAQAELRQLRAGRRVVRAGRPAASRAVAVCFALCGGERRGRVSRARPRGGGFAGWLSGVPCSHQGEVICCPRVRPWRPGVAWTDRIVRRKWEGEMKLREWRSSDRKGKFN